MEKLERSLGGIKDMNGLPDAMFIVDVGHEKIAVKESTKMKIPVVGVVDTNNSPANLDYIIPGNDDAIRAITLYANGIANAITEGCQASLQMEIDEDEFVEVEEVDTGSELNDQTSLVTTDDEAS